MEYTPREVSFKVDKTSKLPQETEFSSELAIASQEVLG